MLPPSLTSTSAVFAPFVLAMQIGTSAAAEAEVRPAARLEVASRDGCATRADLIARVLARSPKVNFHDETGSIEIRVRVENSEPGKVVGEVELSRPGAQPSTRRVVATSCAEVSDAVAVIVAIALGQATAGGASSSKAHGNGKPRAASATRSDASATSEPSAAGTSDANAQSGQTPDSSRGRFGALLAAQSFVAPAPGVMLGVAVYVTVGLDRAAPWSPALVLGATSAWRSDIDVRGGTASFVLDAATLDACPLRLVLGSVETRVCGSALGGRLTAEGTNTLNTPGAVERPFWMLGGSTLFTAALGSRFEMSARLAGGVNLVRDDFKFEPIVFHEVPAFTLSTSVGFGLRLP